MTKVYNFDAQTGAYIHTAKARLDPLDHRPLVPASATLIAPPETGANEVAAWSDGAWTIKPDHRGVEYWLADGSHRTITEIGAERPPEALNAPPPMPVHKTADVATQAAYRWIEDFVHNNVDGGKPPSEISMYAGRELAARAIKDGTASPQQRAKLLALLTLSGKTEAEAKAALPALVDRIIAKADARNRALALTTAMREQVEASIAAADPAADPFAYDKILAKAAQDAAAAWEAMPK